MECCSSVGESDLPLTIVSEENRRCGRQGSSSGSGCELVSLRQKECIITATGSVAALPSLAHHCSHVPGHHATGSTQVDDALSPSSEQSLSEMSATAEHISFSKEVIAFSLFGRIHPKCSKFWKSHVTYSLKLISIAQIWSVHHSLFAQHLHNII